MDRNNKVNIINDMFSLINTRALQYRIAEDTGYELLSTLLVVSVRTPSCDFDVIDLCS